jgi:geranylgeranyl diphosphate synthase type II
MMKTSSEVPGCARAVPSPEFLTQAAEIVDNELDRILPAESVSPSKIHAAIRWSVFAGGKRFRPALLLAAGETFGAARESLIATASALEMIHTYSLVHDDLPSMDNDDLRRGRPTCHVQFGEATAILAGDALLTLAFRTVSEDDKLPATKRAGLISEIARAAGTPDGMVAGQGYDLDAESQSVATEELERIHRLKTGALIVAAARCGAIIANAPTAALEAVTDYAGQLGLLFQITDDLLDVTATAETIGKTPGKDERARKATYPALYGVEATRKHLASTHTAAVDALSRIDRPTDLLRSIADFILKREA